jgi:hypothetical protein
MRTASLTSLRKMLSSLVLCLCLSVIATAQAEPQPNPPASPDDVTRYLLQRLQELESEVKDLRAHSAAPAPAVVAAPAPAPVLAPALALASAAPPAAEPSQSHDANVPGFAERSNGPSMGVRYDFDANGTFKLQYDRVSGAICLLRTH